jgi:hypothetical protein
MTLRSVSALEKEIEELEKQAGMTQEEPEADEVDEPVAAVEVPSEPEPVKEATDPEEKNWAKRYADLRTLQQKTAAQLKEALAQKTTPSAVTEDQVKDWIKTNPKAAEIIKAIAVKSTPVEDLEEIKLEIAQTKARNTIMKAHPDFDDITDSDAFHEWADLQPPRVQELIFSDKPDDVVWALSFYKEQARPKVDTKRDAAKQVRTKSGTDAPSDKSSPVYSESMVQKMSLTEYEKHEAAILTSQKSGNFLYDLSGAAR